MHAFSPLIYNRTSGLYLFKTKFKSFLHQTENWINSTINHHLSFRGINLFQIIKRFQGMVLQMKYPILSFHQEWGIFTYTHMILKCTHNFNYLESRKFLSSWRNKYLCFMLAYLIGFLNVQILVFTSCSFMCEFFGKWF